MLGKKDFKLAFEKFTNRKGYRINYNFHAKKYLHLKSGTAQLPTYPESHVGRTLSSIQHAHIKMCFQA